MWRSIQILPLSIVALFLVISLPINATNSSDKVEEANMAPQLPDPSIKCGSCPCTNPCGGQQLPLNSPPPPPSPLRPPPSPPSYLASPYSPPKPAIIVVTAPPPPRFIYVTGPPGDGYSGDEDPFTLQVYYGGTNRYGCFTALLVVVSCLVLEMLLF